MARPWSLLVVAVLISGCAHYRLGTGTKPSFATLYIEPAKNQTLLPQSRAPISIQVREAFERDGRLTLVDSPQEADATLQMAAIDYHRDIAANREDDTGLARKFVLTLTLSCSLKDNHTGRMLFDKRLVTAHSEIFVDNGLGSLPVGGPTTFGVVNDQLQAEYNNVPILAQALADKVTHAVLDVW